MAEVVGAALAYAVAGTAMTDLSPESELEQVATRSKKHHAADDSPQSPPSPTEPPKKKRRSVKPNADKKFECKHENCGKSYSRAEHLYRHQLNHTPKQIYRCDFPDCNRYFVRQDLCVRHRERHTTQGSQLQKRDSFTQSSTNHPLTGDELDDQKHTRKNEPSPHEDGPSRGFGDPLSDPDTAPAPGPRPRAAKAIHPGAENGKNYDGSRPSLLAKPHPPFSPSGPLASTHLSPKDVFPGTGWDTARRRSSFLADRRHPSSVLDGSNINAHPPGTSMPTFANGSAMSGHMLGFKPPADMFPAHDYDPRVHAHTITSPVGLANPFHSPHLTQPLPTDAFVQAVSQGLTAGPAEPYAYLPANSFSATDAGSGYGYPIFGGDDFNRSPLVLGDDFTSWLFNDAASGPLGFSPTHDVPKFGLTPIPHQHAPYFLQSPTSLLNSRTNEALFGNPMDLTNVVRRSTAANCAVSEDKRQELLDIMQTQFIERPHDAVRKRKHAILEGDMDAPDHVLSLSMMHNYIGSYWYHQHAQLPILHRPTFAADHTPNLLLLAIIAIGAATLDKAYGPTVTDAAAEFANFLAWHVRWEIIRDADFRPPAKLWIFQTLLLIEVYEKMYSTRALHERAHIHHDSTLTLMRRGSSLTGKPASGTPTNGHADGAKAENVSDSQASWESWIDGESTRRVAFAAFVIDSIHCTMFGHSAKMVAHEMRLPLPCDEGLWSALTPAEASRLNATLLAQGVKQIMFLDSLRKTLRGEKVRTNTFGRTIIMAGLLSVSYHMNQRDIQMMSLGQGRGSFGMDKSWKSLLLRAYDNWKQDFDESLDETGYDHRSPVRRGSAGADPFQGDRSFEDDAIFESRTVLHHLAHIAAHVDIVACQIFAGANRLLSRSVTPKDYIDIRGKVEKWATKASARDSAFYALKFIAQVLAPRSPPDDAGTGPDGYAFGLASPILPQAFERDRYVARDDFLLNRPWVLYVSALVVWCYGFALEGPLVPAPRDQDFATYEQREADMRKFLDRVAGVEAPDDLEHITGKNRCLGMLLILKESFASTRWELTHEASRLLGNAALKLKGAIGAETTMKRKP